MREERGEMKAALPWWAVWHTWFDGLRATDVSFFVNLWEYQYYVK